RAPRFEPREVTLQKPELAIKRRNRIPGVAPQIERELEKQRAHQLAVKATEAAEMTRGDRGALERLVHEPTENGLSPADPEPDYRDDAALEQDVHRQQDDYTGEC